MKKNRKIILKKYEDDYLVNIFSSSFYFLYDESDLYKPKPKQKQKNSQ